MFPAPRPKSDGAYLFFRMLQKYTTISRRRNFFNEYGVFHHENPRICGKRDAIRWKIGRFCSPYGACGTAERRPGFGRDEGRIIGLGFARVLHPAASWRLLGACCPAASWRLFFVSYLPSGGRRLRASRRGSGALRFVNLGGFRLFAVFIAQGGRESGLRIFQTFYCIFYCISLDHVQKRPDFGTCGSFAGLGRLAGGMAIWLAGLRPAGDGTILQ